ncbi:MAG: NifB/NifX family molybdenum-iron cluster-binding protein [Candidatus Altiarchaeota archaeon]
MIDLLIAFPTDGDKGWDEELSQHFGRSTRYTLVNDEDDSITVIENTSQHMGGMGMPPEILSEAGVNVIICRGLGRRAIEMFSEFNIQVYCDASGTVGQVFKQWKAGGLLPASEDNSCTRHDFRSEHHGSGNCGRH